ncbi:hypothetical protein [Paracoccus sp. KR1-242]|uniref:hypothetical protein n=1 Tax=Paracoccus sp. KR1-242 TaxID=3410028 RepID=UPI003C08A12A
MTRPANCLDYVAIVCIGPDLFVTLLIVDLGVSGEISHQLLWSGRSYEDAIIDAERVARVHGLPVIDRVAT